jgi:hypothetical protein
MIPPFTLRGELPPGEFLATLNEVEERFGLKTRQRKKLMRGLRKAASHLWAAGGGRLWIDGSFITDKAEPDDIDGCWEYIEGQTSLESLDPAFVNGDRDKMRSKYGLDFFLANWIEAGSGQPFPKFFQTSRDGRPKGIIVLKRPL